MKNNNLRTGFFKPTKGKFLLFAVIVLLGVVTLYLLLSTNVYLEKGVKNPFLSNPLFWVILLPIFAIMVNGYLVNSFVIFTVAIILQLIYSYLLSCILVWLYSKIQS